VLGAGCRELFGFFEAVAVGFDLNDRGAVDEPIDVGYDAGGVGKDLPPFGVLRAQEGEQLLVQGLLVCVGEPVRGSLVDLERRPLYQAG
jgi:hypothetical protein